MRQNCTFQILAPSIARPTNSFARLKSDKQSYNHLLASMQRLRARVYLKDGAIQPWEIDNDGRFHMPGDEQCWHLLLVDDAKEVVGCARYLVHDKNVRYENLRVSHSPLAKDASWGEKLRTAVDSDLQRARAEGLCYVEVGGWALAEEWRNTKAALEILVGSFALGELWGGCLGSCTATVRHGSSSILRRIGGTSLRIGDEVVPPYDDPEYGCVMEVLRFDYRSPTKRFMPFINQLTATLSKCPVLCPSPVPAWGLNVRPGAYLPEQAARLELTPAFQ